MSRRPWQASFLLLAAIWGCSFWWIKLGLRAGSPVDVAFGRLALGALALLAISGLTRTALPRRRSTWRHLFVLGVLLNSAPFTLFAYGETHISAVLAALINAATPLATLLVTVAVFRQERPTRAGIGGLALGFAGVLVVVGAWRGLGSGQLLGIGACLLAIACYGASFPYSRRYLADRGDGPVALATGQVLCGAAQLLPFAVLTGHLSPHPPLAALAALAALGALGSGIAYVLYHHVVSSTSGTVASTVTYLIPVFAVIAGAVFLREPVSWYEPVGGAIVLLGAAVSQGRIRLRPRPPTVGDPA